MSDGFVSGKLSLVENLPVNSTLKIVSWASIIVFEELVVQLVEFGNDVRAGLSN